MSKPVVRLADPLDVIPLVEDAAERNRRYPTPSKISTRQRVQRRDTGQIERWNGTGWEVMVCAECVATGVLTCRDSVSPLLSPTPPTGAVWDDEYCYYVDTAELNTLALAGGNYTGAINGVTVEDGTVTLVETEDGDAFARLSGSYSGSGLSIDTAGLPTTPLGVAAANGYWCRLIMRWLPPVQGWPDETIRTTYATQYAGLPIIDFGWCDPADSELRFGGGVNTGRFYVHETGYALSPALDSAIGTHKTSITAARPESDGATFRAFVFKVMPSATPGNMTVSVYAEGTPGSGVYSALTTSAEIHSDAGHSLWPTGEGLEPLVMTGTGFFMVGDGSYGRMVTRLDQTRLSIIPVSVAASFPATFGTVA